MSEVEKQEGQKTVVAFVAGLLIGGLLVWVFSAPEATEQVTEQTDDETTTEVTATDGDDVTTPTGTSDSDAADTSASAPAVAPGDGALVVADQPANTVVTLSDVEYPANEGWIAVRDYSEGVVGGILGAARFNLEVGLLPTEVELVRPEGTTAGNAYAVVFFTEDGAVNQSGNLYFDPAGDQQLQGIQSVFTAQ